MTRLILYLTSFLSGLLTANAQQITGRIIDSETRESIPYATIKIGNTDLISNEDGYFAISESTSESALVSVSYIGYAPQKISVIQLKQNNNVIALVQGSYEIDSVSISNVKPDPNEILKLVNENLTKNHSNTNYKYTVFIRNSQIFKPKKLDIEITKSTGFSKTELKKMNEDLTGFSSGLISHPPQEFTDKLAHFYSSLKKFEGRNYSANKLKMVKAVKLKDESRSTDLDDLEKTATDLLFKHIDTTKFYRIKSGLFGSRDTISFSKEYNEKEKIKRQRGHTVQHKNLSQVRFEINSIIHRNSFRSTYQPLDFIAKTDMYLYTFVEAIYLDDHLVYVIEFKPGKKKAKYAGKLYINESDYAILRADYDLAAGKTLSSINLKLILGVKSAENISRGTIIHKKNPHNDTYYLYYSLKEFGQYFYVNRPLKLIEITKNKKERDRVAFELKVEGNQIKRTEYLNTEVQECLEKELDTVQEQEFEYQILKKYDPNIWRGYNIIEPLEEMKKFKVIE